MGADGAVGLPIDVALGEHASLATTRLSVATSLDVMPGEPPNARSLRGTIFLAWSLEGVGVAVTEWDLAAGRALRQTGLGLPRGDVAGARVGDELHVVAAVAGGEASWIVLDARRLKVIRRVRLGPAGAVRVATDGALTLIALDEYPSWTVSTFDRSGHVLGSWRPREPMAEHGPQTAVLNGRAYVLDDDGTGSAIVELSREATPVGRVTLSAAPVAATIRSEAGRLFVALESELLELSPDMRVLERRRADAPIGMFDLAPNGRLLGECGELFSRDLRRQAGMHALASCQSVLWSGDTPVAVSTYMEPSHEVQINWLEPRSLAAP